MDNKQEQEEQDKRYIEDLNSLLNELPEDQRAYIKKTIDDYRNLIQTNIVDNLVSLLSINNSTEEEDGRR